VLELELHAETINPAENRPIARFHRLIASLLFWDQETDNSYPNRARRVNHPRADADAWLQSHQARDQRRPLGGDVWTIGMDVVGRQQRVVVFRFLTMDPSTDKDLRRPLSLNRYLYAQR
jgi:hypothetical protein